MNRKQIKRNQHYVPQSYLKRFTIEGEKSLLWNYDKTRKDFMRTPSSINRVCCEDYYYYQIDEAGEVNHTKLEDEISNIERIGNNLLDKIINMHAMPYVYLSPEEKGQLAFYISLMLTRGPGFRDAINHMHGDLAAMSLPMSYGKGMLDDAPEIIKKLVDEKGLFSVVQPHVHSFVSLPFMIQGANEIAKSLLSKEWFLLLSSSDSYFITSDNPVSFFSKTGLIDSMGPAHKDSVVIFPVSPRLCLVIEMDKSVNLEINVLQTSAVHQMEINRLVFRGAMNNVFSFRRTEWIKRFGLDLVGGSQRVIFEGVRKENFQVIKNPYRKLK
ncbi:DUF4238 domain-containing protein [Escherichia coli]|uniref:DUF4238 domain-containing protein n=1 Tax=Escherichia coli TaxID=562 RepID=UPI000B7E9638|nr:DUF4238 domain-containing protein [Escherichia coli]